MTGEEYFKDKIDWKFINYLIDKCTQMEDLNLETEIEVRSHIDLSNGISIVTPVIVNVYNDLENESASTIIYPLMIDNNLDNCIRNYEKYGLIYCLKIPSKKYKDMYESFYESKLKKRCTKVNAHRMNLFIVLKPNY